jgi:hypothetical protein
MTLTKVKERIKSGDQHAPPEAQVNVPRVPAMIAADGGVHSASAFLFPTSGPALGAL